MRRIPEFLVEEFVKYVLSNVNEFAFNKHRPGIIKISTNKVRDFLESYGITKYEFWELASFMELVSQALRKHGYTPIGKHVTVAKGRKTNYYFAQCADGDCQQYIELLNK
jgi:hypothetical protein